ncbi:MAG: hypothetical protein M1820_009400 [Bogoriella megaspora]|nr:MAG: hypothetical protein M1820_009400 [Bogoriella megaspora]
MDPELGQGTTFTRVAISTSLISVGLAAYRVISMSKAKNRLGVEDYMVICSARRVDLKVETSQKHSKYVRLAFPVIQLETDNLKYFFLFQLFYKITINLNKLAILSLYYCVFSSCGFRKICLGTVGVVALGTLSFFIATIFQCIPVEKAWHRHMPGQCIDNPVFRWAWATYNTTTDIFIVFMPFPIIRRLQMDKTKKAGLIVLFSLGLFVCATSAFRMWAIVIATEESDTTLSSMPAVTWSVVEAAAGLSCVCLPALKKPVSKLLPKSWTRPSFGSASAHRPRYSYGPSNNRITRLGDGFGGYQCRSRIESVERYPGILGMGGRHGRESDEEEYNMKGIRVKRDITVVSHQGDEISLTNPDQDTKQSMSVM